VRLPGDQDVDALVRYADDADVAETVWVPIPTPCGRAQAVERLDDFKRGWDEECRFGPALIVADADADAMIGIVFFRLRESDSVELSYGVAPAHRNRDVGCVAGHTLACG
jgi:RimJ/RimL family protein N-acetyltransferase